MRVAAGFSSRSVLLNANQFAALLRPPILIATT
jgi:hypothetical protein